MKKHKYVNFLSLITLVLFTSCSENFLEVEPQGAPTVATFFKTESDVVRATNALYTMNDFQGTYGRGMFLYSLIASDDFIVGKSKSQIEDIKDFLTTGSGSYTRDIWTKHYQVVKRANDILNNKIIICNILMVKKMAMQ